MPTFPDRPLELEPGCDRCPDLVASRERIAWGAGPRDARVAVVGEAPADGNPDAGRWRGGNWTGMAYTSRHSGRRIRALFERLGYADEAYYTNAVKCFPAASGDASTNREPTDAERAACRTHLLEELAIVEPSVVVTTGKHATRSMLEAAGRELNRFLDTVLDLSRCESLDVWVLPILHPSYQDVWVSRLGYESEEYETAITDALATVLDE